MSRTAETLAHGRDNNFNLIRMVAASAVIVSHSFPLALGEGAWEPLSDWAPFSLGGAAVIVFFTLSGFLVMKSFQHSSQAQFTIARVGRIVPGLLFAWLAVMPIAAATNDFAGNPHSLVNGSLWTLWFEAVCYVVMALAGIIGAYRVERFPYFMLAALAVFCLITAKVVPIHWAYATFGFAFLLGMVVYQYRDDLPLDGRLALLLWLLASVLRVESMWTVALGYSALWAAAALPSLRGYNRLGDYSYGTYIFGWPVQQMVVMALPGLSPFGLMAIALPCAWALGIVSWYSIERPALRFVRVKRARSGVVYSMISIANQDR